MNHALRLRVSSHVLMVVSWWVLAPVPGCGGGGTADPDPCASGTFDDDGDATTACVAWTACAAGEYVSASGTPTMDRTCADCATGTFSTAANTAACAAFTTCAAGSFVRAAGTSSSDQACTECATGSFSEGSDPARCTAHSDCQPGTARIALGTATADASCAACMPGSFEAGINEASCEAWTTCADRFLEGQAGSATLDRTCVAEEWDVQVGTSTTDEAMALALDSDGNAYVVGRTAGELPMQTYQGGTDW